MQLDIYGKVRTLTGISSFIPFRYQGQYDDAETGLYYNRFRYYDCERGGYISKDPIGLIGGYTLYCYVANANNSIDPFGLSPFDPFTVGEITSFPKDLHFGQNRISPNFRNIGSQADDAIVGRAIGEVANDISTGKIDPNIFVISYTIDPKTGKAVTLNNRGLATLSEGGKLPDFAIYVPYEKAPSHLVEDFKGRQPSKTIDVTRNKDGSGFIRKITNYK